MIRGSNLLTTSNQFIINSQWLTNPNWPVQTAKPGFISLVNKIVKENNKSVGWGL